MSSTFASSSVYLRSGRSSERMTSAVDMETEKQIQHSLRNLDFPCTKIIIAQRISTTKFCDKILVLKDGRIIESGNHRELVEADGYYAELVKLQLGESAVSA